MLRTPLGVIVALILLFVATKAVLGNVLSDLPKRNICGDNTFIESYSIKNKNNKKKILTITEKTMQDCRKSVENTSLFHSDSKNAAEDPCAMSLVQLGMSTLYYLDIQKERDGDFARKELSETLGYFKEDKTCKIKKEDDLPEVFIVKKSIEYALAQSSK